jgi:hypothetical protein
MKQISRRRRLWFACALLLVIAFGFRLFIALRLPNDNPDDGRVYAQIARNVLEQHVYSHASQPPYAPSFIRLPGYPLFLAGLYVVFGHENNTAVRIAQVIIDTATCALVALIAFLWVPYERRKVSAALGALLLAAICPFTTIYVSTILTEVITSFLAVSMCLLATLAFQSTSRKRALLLWTFTGLAAGTAVLFRPDSGLFAAAIGSTIVICALVNKLRDTRVPRWANLTNGFYAAAIFSLAFCLVLVPWTIRNQRVFHLFQPLSPAHGEMPGEFVPRGYQAWLRSWISDGRYIGPLLWSLDSAQISMDDLPDEAFDSDEERDRVEALVTKYNHPPDEDTAEPPSTAGPTPQSSPAASPTPEPTPATESGEEAEQGAQPASEEASTDVEMTPEIDAEFAQIARERIARAPLRYYLVLPIKRAGSLWFDTHSQYYPFEGDLLPLDDLDYADHQQYWLPLFVGLTWLYTILGVAGAFILWCTRNFAARRCVLLAGLLMLLRLGFFSTMENPEPRYVVELFPFLAIFGGIAISWLGGLGKVVGTYRFNQG